jgi:dihydrofolate reductase / thymidylate synthase
MSFTIIVAFDDKYGIGKKGGIPWSYPEDLRRFSALTRGHALIMGRQTYESLPSKFRPLPNRVNIVLSSNPKPPDESKEVAWVGSIDAAVSVALATSSSKIFVIGGESIYKQFLDRGLVSTLLVTKISGNYECDKYFQDISNEFELKSRVASEAHGFEITYDTYIHKSNNEEQLYLDLVKEAITNGIYREDRTKIGTHSLFGRQMRFDLTDGKIPLLTTKKVFWKGIVKELLWILSGCTDTKVLDSDGIKFWNANSTREFLDKRGLNYPVGEMGPTYGWQMRSFGQPYNASMTEYNYGGDEYWYDTDDYGIVYRQRESAVAVKVRNGCYRDQLKDVIELLKNDPMTRRAIITLWNPNQLKRMALPPCLMQYQFWISSNKKLHCSTYQRSGDLGLGVPFNIASASLFTHLIARATNTVATELVHFIADAHVYSNHVESLQRQILRNPRQFPTIEIDTDAPKNDIWNIKYEQIHLKNYNYCKPNIKMTMAV